MKVHRSPCAAVAATLCGVGLAFAGPAFAQQQFPATLAGHAALPAETFVQPPADAPAAFRISGRFAGPGNLRTDEVGSIPGVSFLSAPGVPRATGLSLPFEGQPIQGFSGIRSLGDGEFLLLIDNGFGSRRNSPDVLLMLNRVRPDWQSGEVALLETIFVSDPNRILPFLLVNEHTGQRYLTGADFDLESVQPVGDRFWFGDEFGPFLFSTDRQGRVLSFHETMVDGRVVRSPDHHAVATPGAPGPVAFEVRRSRGFEGMAASPDGRFLYPLLEGPLWDAEAGGWENRDGREYLRILEFDVERGEYTDRSWRYQLEVNGNNIGDFNMIDATRGLVIERDNNEGDPAQACQGEPQPDCFNAPARFKRIYLIDFAGADADGFVRRIGYIDLMDIADPNGVARIGGAEGRFTFPFVTIENVDMVDADTIIVANDNNLPFSTGRRIGAQDDNEFILLTVSEFLRAR